jgi:hypothetical protein
MNEDENPIDVRELRDDHDLIERIRNGEDDATLDLLRQLGR